MTASKIDFSGEWHNEHASHMRLTVAADGKLTGTYHTAVGAPKPFEEFDLVGFASGDLIAFTVNFGKYESMTAWVGQHTVEEGVEKIHTMWHLAVNIEDRAEHGWLWAGTRSGSDMFVRGPHPTGTAERKAAPSHPLGRLTAK